MTALFFWVFPMVLGADPPPRIEYQAPGDCPTSTAFLGEVRARLDGIGVGQIEDPRITVTIERAGGKLRGRLVVEREGEARLERAVEARHCTDLASALALIIALSLQERAAAQSTGEVTTAAVRPAPPLVAPEPFAESRWRLGGGVGVDTAIGMAPDVLLAIPIFVEARFRGDRLHPEIRLALVQTLTDRAQSGPATADFSALFGELDLCPTAFRVGRYMQIAPCARVQAGTLSARGEGLSMSRSETRPWLATLALLRGRATMGSRLFAQLEIGIGFPLTRDRFTVDPGILVWEIPTTMFASGAALGVAFW